MSRFWNNASCSNLMWVMALLSTLCAMTGYGVYDYIEFSFAALVFAYLGYSIRKSKAEQRIIRFWLPALTMFVILILVLKAHSDEFLARLF